MPEKDLRRWIDLWLAAEPPPEAVRNFVERSRNGLSVAGAVGEAEKGERYLLDIIDNTSKASVVIVAQAVLGDTGSLEAVPHLARHIHDGKDDIKASALCALTKLGDSSLTPIFLDALTDRSSVAKAKQ